MKRNPNFISRTVAGELVLVPIAHEAADLQSVLTLNEVGARVWELLDECGDAASVAHRLCDEFDVDFETALADVSELIEKLTAMQAIVDA